MKKNIYITVKGGVIQDISDIPAGVKVVVMDFDTEAYGEDDLQPSPLNPGSNELCHVSVYGHPTPAEQSAQLRSWGVFDPSGV